MADYEYRDNRTNKLHTTRVILGINNWSFNHRIGKASTVPRCQEKDWCIQLKFSSDTFKGPHTEIQHTKDGQEIMFDRSGLTMSYTGFCSLMRDPRLHSLLETATSYHQNHSPSKKQSLETPLLLMNHDNVARGEDDDKDDEDDDEDGNTHENNPGKQNHHPSDELNAEGLGLFIEASIESPPSPIIGERKKNVRRRLSYSPDPEPASSRGLQQQQQLPELTKQAHKKHRLATQSTTAGEGGTLRFYKKNDL